MIVRLRTMWEEKYIKQKALADAIGVSPFLVSKWKKSSRQLDFEMAYQMSRYLNVTLDELMGEPKQNRASLNMDQMTLFDVDSYQKTKVYLFELFFIAFIFIWIYKVIQILLLFNNINHPYDTKSIFKWISKVTPWKFRRFIIHVTAFF